MKKFTSLLILMIFASSGIFAQANAREHKKKSRFDQSVFDVGPNLVLNPHATTFTDDLFDHQFDFICGDASGEAGIETNGNYIYTSLWNSTGFCCYEMDGTFLGTFQVPGESAVRDLAYDGTYFYGAAASTQLFEMDFVGQSGTLISTLTAAVATRAIAYNPDYDAFYANNWSDPITLYDRTGSILNQFNCGAYSSYYGFAWLNDAGTPWLYGFAQAGGVSTAVIVQLDPETGTETGVTFDAIGYSSGTSQAGGLASFDTWAPGWWTLLGIIQDETIFGVEGGVAGPPPDLDLKLTGIYEPNSGFGLVIEDIVIGVKNLGAITQSNFDVRYRVNGGAWRTETIAGPLAMGESITYTFNQAYNFSAYGIYYIEAEVILSGDEHPDNNFADKTIENKDPSQFCEYSITLWDDYGDGWNGGYVQIFGDGVEYINATLAAGAGPETLYFDVEDDAFLTTVWTAGGWPYECSYIIYDMFGEPIFEDGMGGVDPTGGDIGYVDCDDDIPIITWDPSSFTQNVVFGGTAQDFLSIGNIGTDILTWNIEVIEPWLVVYPDGGTIEPGGSHGIIIDFNAEGLDEGSYFADILITSNDPFTPEVIIPVEMIVGPIGQHFVFEGGNISAPYWSLFLAEATINDINMVTGDEIGIFDGDVLVGVITLTQVCTPDNQFENALLAFSTLEGGIQGYTPGNNVTLKCWDANEQLELSEFDIVFDDPYGDAWTESIFPEGNGQYSIPHINFVYAGTPPILISATSGYEEITLEWEAVPEDNKTIQFNIYYEDGTLVAASVEGTTYTDSDLVAGQMYCYYITQIYETGLESSASNVLCAIPIGYGNIAGIAYDDENIPLAGVEILIEETGISTITNELGEYLFEDIVPGTYNLTASKFSYYSGNIYNVIVQSNQTTILNFFLEAKKPILISATPSFDEITLEWEAIPENNKTNHFNFVGGDPSSPVWTIYIGGATIDGIDMEAGDEIGFFDGELLVGAFTLDQVCTPDNQFDNDFIAFSVLQTGQGYVAGNSFTMVAWDESEGEESINFEYIFSDPYGGAWTGDVFPSGDGQYSMAEFAFFGYIPSFNIYYEDGTLVATEVEGTTYTDTDLIAGQEYCYYVTQIDENGFESVGSNILCAIPLYPPYGTITGIIIDMETSLPIEGALVEVEGTTFSATTLSDGTYIIENVDIGIYAVSASADNYISETIPDQTVSNGGTTVVDFELVPIITQVYDLETGYQFISTRAQPDNPNMLNIVDNLLDNLDFIRNTGGLMVRKIGPVWINSIGNWVTTEGYLFKMNSEDQLAITGIPIDPQTPINLSTGYQIISYLPWQALNALDVCENILDNLDFVRNTGGFMLRKIGPVWINGIGNMNQGEGYLVKMNAPDVLIYPVSDKKFTGIANLESDHFNFEGGNAAEPVFTIYVEGLDIGDEVAAYNGDILIGAMKINSINAFDNDLPVFNTLNSGKGYKASKPIILKVWDASAQSLIPFEYTYIDPYNEAYMEHVYPSEDGLYSVINISKGVNNIGNAKEAISIFPNPSEGIFNISIEGVSGKVQIKVFDVHGNNYRFFEIEGTNNLITEKLDLKELAAGVYFISFSGKDFSRVKKIVIQ
jgi:hypothetical protein